MNTKHCVIDYADEKLVKALTSVVGNNQALINGIITKVIDSWTSSERIYSKGFVQFVNDNYKRLANSAAKGSITEPLAKAMLEYYNVASNRVSSFVKSNNVNVKVATYGYTDINSRQIGIGHAVIDVLIKYQDSGMTLDSKKEYLKHLRDIWFSRLCQLAVDNKIKSPNTKKSYASPADVKKEYDAQVKGKIAEIDSRYEQEINDRINEVLADEDILGGKEEDRIIKEITDELNEKRNVEKKSLISSFEFFKNILGDKLSNITVKNTLAFYCELTSDSALENNSLLNDILYSSKAQDIYHKINHDDVVTSADIDQGELELNGVEDASEDGNVDLDISFRAFDHSGIHKTYMAHLGTRLRTYFNTLPKLLDANELQSYVTNNLYCIPEYMDARECVTELYNANLNWNNLEEMIATIRDIALKKEEFAGFIKLAEDLKSDPDFATELSTVFSKIKIDKVEVVENNGSVKTDIANKTANSRNIFMSKLLNDSKNNLGLTSDSLTSIIGNFNERLDDIKKILKGIRKVEELNGIKDDIIKIITLCYPSASKTAIKSYIEINNSEEPNAIIRQFNNIVDLYDDVVLSTITAATNAMIAKTEIQRQYEAAKEINDRIAADRAAGNFTEDFKDLAAIYANDSYINSFYAPINNLINKILPYSVIKTEFNHRNIEGNNNSDIINNSMLGAIHKMMAQTTVDEHGNLVNPVLVDWISKKLALPQYKYNTILETHRDANNNVTQYGIVEYDNATGKYKLCEWATELFDVQLFQGSSSMTEGKNVPYPKMTTGDYLPTRFLSYFTTATTYGSGVLENKLATYFTKTPSDAPKIYTFRAPRIDTTGLFRIKNEAEHNAQIDEAVRGLLNIVPFEEFKNDYVTSEAYDNFIKNEKQFWSTFIASDKGKLYNLDGQELYINKRQSIKSTGIDGKSIVVFRTDDGAIVAIEGIVSNRNGAQYLTQPKIVGTALNVSNPDSIVNAFTNAYKEQSEVANVTLTNGTVISKAEFYIDKTHPVFALVKNQYRQELLDAVNALYTLFEFRTPQTKDIDGNIVNEKTNDLVIQLVDGLPVFRSGFDNKSGYKFYHKGGKNNTVYDVVDGKAVLNGNVFKSNRFTLVIDKVDDNGKLIAEKVNFMDSEEYGNPVVELLYGGAIRVVENSTADGRKGVDFYFEESQADAIEENIDNRIEQYLIAYVSQAKDIISSYSEFTNNVKVTSDRVIEYSVNELLMSFNADMLFDGNSKFYKDSQTVLKRVKQSQGSGVPYGIADTTGTIVNPLTTEVAHSYLNSPEVQEVFKGTILEGTKQTYGFTGVTISNTQKTNHPALVTLAEKLVSIGNLTKDEAYELLYGDIARDENGNYLKDKEGNIISRNGFTNTKVNDAQSYITIQEFVRRIAGRGQLKKYLPLIKKILDESQVLTAEEIKEFIQVQKNFYYDMTYDDVFNIETPRQIKNAEFVLVPRFIKGTQLEAIYDIMIEHGINQLNTIETSKASNKDPLSLWDNNGDITEKTLNDFSTKVKDSIQVFQYSNLYTQQETPQHMNAENKAGIQIVKKIIDNLPNTKYWNDVKELYFELFSANIKESFTKVAKEFELTTDENGNILFNNVGGINIDKEKFFEKLKEELMRNGIDNNMLKCCTIEDGETEPIMPLTINNLITKFESVTQSIFNSNITRQKLPGFHAAQVTNVGWKGIETVLPNYTLDKLSVNVHYKEFVKANKDKVKTVKKNGKTYLSNDTKAAFSEFIKNKFKNISYNKELRYHPDGKGYIEILVPYSFLGIDKSSPYYSKMTDEQILQDLAKQGKDGKYGLNDLIGYRIPTEGKQSMCNMKVVGFLDDSLGSTIIVPDDWVSQTGSDFDIDSVYAITYEVKKSRTGKLIKQKFIDEPTVNNWIDYLDNALDLFKILKQDKYKEFLKAEQEAYNTLDENTQIAIKKIHVENKKLLRTTEATQRKTWSTSLKLEITKLVDKKTSLDPKVVNYIKALKEITTYLDDTISSIGLETLDKLAKENGLLTKDEYFNKDNRTVINNRQQRNSKILELMQEILYSDEALEENLSRSNFDAITEAKNIVMSDYAKIHREGRSPYNPFDQIAYQEEAMSGAKLKGFSVTLDTLCSVCNTVRPNLNNTITIVYDDGTYSTDRIKQGFDNVSGTNAVVVKHNTYGWSKNNRNVVGKLITAYSSQTTAFILDAIKEGSIPNVNDYTFSVFKTFPNIGSDYKTAIGFMLQPGISRIVNENNKNKSVFSSSFGDPITKAIESIAKELGIPNTNGTTRSILNAINTQYNAEFKRIFGISDSKFEIALTNQSVSQIPIHVSKLLNRINEVEFTSPVEKLLFDLGVIIQFNYIKNIADNIGDIARCCNPDKFGAKQTVYATREVFNNIESSIRSTKVLTVKGKHVLDAIYPGVVDEVNKEYRDIELYKYVLTKCDVKDSLYPTLCSYLKYSSALSIAIARNLFDTQSKEFVELVEGISSIASNYKSNKLTEETAVDVQKYILSSFYNEVPSVKFPISITLNEDRTFTMNVPEDNRANVSLIDSETTRIYGYGHAVGARTNKVYTTPDGKRIHTTEEFTCKDINNPTQEEINDFLLLSPAQKVYWIQNAFEDAGIFEYIKPTLVTSIVNRKQVGMQTLSYTEDQVDPNTMFDEFVRAFNSTNPLIAAAALDVIKYAIQVEGMIMSNTAVNKVIDYSVLINDLNDGGIGFVDVYNQKMADLYSRKHSLNTIENVETLYENYLRSHPNCPLINSANYVSPAQRKRAGLSLVDSYSFRLTPSRNTDGSVNMNDYYRRIKTLKLGTVTDEGIKWNKYVRLNIDINGRTNVLYKIVPVNGDCYIYPLSNLQANENSRYSANANNTEVIKSKEYYEALIGYLVEKELASISEYAAQREFITGAVKEVKESLIAANPNDENVISKRKIFSVTADTNLDFDTALANPKDRLHSVVSLIADYFSKAYDFNGFAVNNQRLASMFVKKGSKHAETITMTLNGVERSFRIWNATPEEFQGYVNYRKTKNGEVGEQLAAIIDNAIEQNRTSESNIVLIKEIVTEPEVMAAATVEDTINDSYKIINSAMINGNEQARFTINSLRQLGITSSVESVKAHPVFAGREMAAYHKAESERLTFLFNHFFEKPSESNELGIEQYFKEYYKATDPEFIAIAKKDPVQFERLIKFVNEVSSFIKSAKGYNDFSVESEDADIRRYVNEISKAYNDVLEMIPHVQLDREIADIITENVSTNPLIKNKLLDVMDGFYKTYGAMWKFHDIMENGTPLLQIIMKDVMGDIDSKRLADLRRHKLYLEKIKSIQDEARKNGKTVDLKKIIDENGDFVQAYTAQFITDLNKYYSDVITAEEKFGKNSVEHLRAKHAYEGFKAFNINQEALPEYYRKKYFILDKIFNVQKDDEFYPYAKDIEEGYAKLQQLQNTIRDLLGDFDIEDRPESVKEQISKCYSEIEELKSDNKYVDGVWLRKTGSEYAVAAKLNEVAKEISSLDEEYFDRIPKHGFEQKLKECLATIVAKENRDANGIPQTSLEKLNNDPEYVKAKSWLYNNASYSPVRFDTKEQYETSIFGKVNKALERLGLVFKRNSGYGGRLKTVSYLAKCNQAKGIKDAYGVYDGRLLTDKEKEDLKQRQEYQYTSGVLGVSTDRALITNINNAHDEHYSKAFWDRLSRTGRINKDYYIIVTAANKVLEKYYNPATQTVDIFAIPDNPEGLADLRILKEAYKRLTISDKYINSTDADGEFINSTDADGEFIKTHVDFKTNTELHDIHKEEFARRSKDKDYSNEYKELMSWVLYSAKPIYDQDGRPVPDATASPVLDKYGHPVMGRDIIPQCKYETKNIVVGTNDDGSPKLETRYVPNRRLYGFIQLKEVLPEGETREQWMDEESEQAFRTLEKYIRKTPTVYYEQARTEAASKGKEYWVKWYNENHVYNPYTRKMEPLDCWLTQEFKYEEINNDLEFSWKPKGRQVTRRVKNGKTTAHFMGQTIEVNSPDKNADKRNPNYKENASVAENYIRNEGSKYNNTVELNEYERQMRDYLQGALIESAKHNPQARKFFEKGHTPRMSKPAPITAPRVGKELSKLFGLNLSTETGKSDFATDKEIDYAFDILPDMPNIKGLSNKEIIEKQNKIKTFKETPILKEKYNSEAEFIKAIDDRNAQIAELKKEIKQMQNDMQNKDWYNVIDTYLSNASRYNAIQDNKQKLYYLLRTLENMQMYSRKYGASGDLKKAHNSNNDSDPIYATEVDANLIAQYKNQLRRLLYDQYRQPENTRTTIANQLQGFTSASYMMMNIKGGIANVTLGESGILGEAAAKEFIGKEDWAFGTKEWSKGVIGFGRRGFTNMLGTDTCFNKQDAIIQYFNVVDYDEHTGVVRELSLDAYAEKLRDIMFSPQTIGEHFMQNSVLFGMLHSHKLVSTPDMGIVAMNKNQYIEYKEAELLKEFLTDAQKEEFEKFKESIKKDKNLLKDYAWFRRNLVTEFVYIHCNKEINKKYIEAKKEANKKYLEEFKELKDIYSQLDFKNGAMTFVEGSQLAKLNNIFEYDGSNVTKAEALLGRFAEKVRKVNNKIHGVYNREGSAYIEKEWFGALLMQYHKHLPMGLLKRYMRRGHYNETRQSVDKGMNESVYDLFALNWRKVKAENNLTDENIGAMQSFLFFWTNIGDYFTQLITTWKIMPEYDRANIRRKWGDTIGVLVALLAVAGLWAAADDDDELEEKVWWNLALYEADRLASEAFMYNPYGLMVEGKKLLSNPVATQSIIEDGFNIISGVAESIFDRDYDPYYQSGRFAGRRKVSVYIQRRIPMYHGIHSIVDLPDNNHYYKLGQNPIGLLDIKERVTD